MRLIIFALCLIPALTTGQTAPDFTVTDSDGIQHSLYQDYLDDGRTVLIEIFFTTCPPCRSIAASTEIFYQQWGAGEYDVEFFELSNKSFDTDELVNGYKAEFGITYPSVGSEGGSLEALAPYLAGEFGQFWGTPTFIVIAPDGTVQWDVNGPDLWEALDTALYATGAMKPGDDPVDTTDMPDDTTVIPTPPVEFGGKIYHYANAQTGVPNAFVTLKTESGAEIARDTTDESGSYSFSLDSSLVADTVMYVSVVKSDDPKSGVTATDLLLIQKHLLGITPMDKVEKLLASDANLNGSISAADLLFLKQLLLDLQDNFPDNNSWIFYPSDLNLGPAGEQPPVISTDPVSVSDILTGVKSPDFKGIKRGDVN